MLCGSHSTLHTAAVWSLLSLSHLTATQLNRCPSVPQSLGCILVVRVFQQTNSRTSVLLEKQIIIKHPYRADIGIRARG